MSAEKAKDMADPPPEKLFVFARSALLKKSTLNSKAD
jgi:hypothetical protein